jgi:hypothetical protein
MMPLATLVERPSKGDGALKCGLNDLKLSHIAAVPYFMISQLKSQAEYLRGI